MPVLLFIALVITSVATQSGHPEFDLSTEEVVFKDGAVQRIECIAKGELPLTYKWYNQRGEEISSDANKGVFTRELANGCILIFDGVNQSHAGFYSCSATNKHGTASKYYDIIVKGTSGNITTNETSEIVSVKVINITENSVEFDVQMTGDPESFYIRYQEKVLKGENSTQIKRGARALVKDLVPAGQYEFRFQIEDPSRTKVKSPVYTVILLPTVPDVIFRKIQDGFVDLEWFRSYDDTVRDTIQEYELTYNRVQQVGGQSWEQLNDCAIAIKIPNRYCVPSKYTLAGLFKSSYYEIRLRGRSTSGYGKQFINKVYVA